MSVQSENFVIENVIISYPKLFKPEPFMQNGVAQGDPFYSCVLLVDEATVQKIYQYAQGVAQSAYTKGEAQDPTFGWPWSPANLKPEYRDDPRTANLYMINAKAGQDYPPQVVGADHQPLIDRGQIYAGCVCAVGINVYSRPQPARPGEVGQGIGVGLKAAMKTADGESLAGDRVDTKALFSGVQAQATPTASLPGGMPMGGGATPPAQTQTQPVAGTTPAADAGNGMTAMPPFPGA